MAFNPENKRGFIFNNFPGVAAALNAAFAPTPRKKVYAEASPARQAEYDSALRRSILAIAALKTIQASREFKASRFAEDKAVLDDRNNLAGQMIETYANFRNGKVAWPDSFPDMTTAISTVGRLADAVEKECTLLTEGIKGSSTKTAAPAKPAQPCFAL